MAIPRKDAALAAWSTNFDTRVSATPTAFGLTAPQATAYTTLHDAFIDAYNAVNTVGARSKALVAAKDTAKNELLSYGRELYAFVQNSLTVTDENKTLLNVVVRKTSPTPIPPPDAAPAIDVISVVGRTVKLRLHDSDDSARRGRPPGVTGASLFSYVGATPPSDPALWRFEGNAGKTIVDVVFADTVAAGAQVWFTAFWFNNRKESGPGTAAVGTYLQGGSSMAA